MKECPVTKKILCIAEWKIRMTEKWLQPLALLAMRLYIGSIFWKSGMTKFNSADGGVDLFQSEYIPNWQKNSVDVLGFDLSWTTPTHAECAAKAAMFGELALPVFLILGLGGRAAAVGLFFMTLVIDTFVYPQYMEHNYWMLITALLVTTGPGKYSIDYFIRKKLLDEKKSCG